MQKNAYWYSQQGLMAGTVFKLVLKSLQDEGHELAPAVQAFMWDRAMAGLTIPSGAACPHGTGGACNCTNCTAGGTGPLACPSNEAKTAGVDRTIVFYECDAWVDNPFPFGSEFAWDSTGQEEEYVWGTCGAYLLFLVHLDLPPGFPPYATPPTPCGMLYLGCIRYLTER